MAKQMRMTCESGYERGRRRLRVRCLLVLRWGASGRSVSNSLVVLLTGGIPKGKLDLLAIDLDIGNVVLEDGRDVDLVG